MIPAIAIVEPNALSAIGLEKLITDIMPMLDVRVFMSVDELQSTDPAIYAHYFVSSRTYFEHTAFFRNLAHKTIVLVSGDLQIQDVPTLNICQSQADITKAIITLYRHAHIKDSHPKSMSRTNAPLLSPRETEVAILLVRGLINKEIADRMHISITTVITHRKNIMEKLHARSLSDVTVYAIMNGLIDIG